MHGLIAIILGTSVTEKVGNQNVVYFLTLPNLCFCITWGNGKPENCIFSLKFCMLFTKKHMKHIKISPGYNWTTFTVQTIDWMHQAGPRILLSVTHMLYVNQVCHCVGRCVKDGSCSSSSLRESQWTVLVGCLTISTNVRRYQTHHRWQFFFQEDSALVHCACNTVQRLQRSRLMQHLSENVIFVFPVLPGSAEAQVTWGGILKHLLIALLYW